MILYRIGRGASKRLHQYFSTKAREDVYRQKISRKCKEFKCKPLTENQKSEVINYYASFGFNNVCLDWHKFHTHLTGKFYKEYIPEDIFHNYLIPSLNMTIMYPGLMDKNLLTSIFRNIRQPEIVVKNINGLYLDSSNSKLLNKEEVIQLCKRYSKLIIKPSIDSGGGKKVVVFELNGDKTSHQNMSLVDLISSYGSNFVIQKLIIQHERMSLLNPTSVNTIRTKSLIVDGQVEILKHFVRIGSLNATIDNIKTGGILCKVGDDGKLVKMGYDRNHYPIEYAPTSIRLEGFEIPSFQKIEDLIKKIHLQVPHFKLISWDVAIDSTGEPVLIEYNTIGQGYGEEYGPIFGKFTNQVLTMCKKT